MKLLHILAHASSEAHDQTNKFHVWMEVKKQTQSQVFKQTQSQVFKPMVLGSHWMVTGWAMIVARPGPELSWRSLTGLCLVMGVLPLALSFEPQKKPLRQSPVLSTPFGLGVLSFFLSCSLVPSTPLWLGSILFSSLVPLLGFFPLFIYLFICFM